MATRPPRQAAVDGAGAHGRVQLNFKDAGSKWLVLAYAKLQLG